MVFDVKVQGMNSCLDYDFIHVIHKGISCDFVRPCNVLHDLATSHNSCIVNCPGEDNCHIVVMIHSLMTNVVGSV